MKKILMLLQSEFPPDIRLEKEIKTLSGADYQVTVMCNQYDKNKSKTLDSCSIKRLSAPFGSPKLNKILNFPLYFNPRFTSLGSKLCTELKPDAIHAHDLPMLPLGLKLGKKFNIPVIFDMHENYPEALKYFNKKGLFNYMFKNYKLAKILERDSLPKADKIIVVVDESKENLVDMGIDTAKVHVVSNTVDIDTFTEAEATEGLKLKYKDKFVILYTGTVSPERGLDTPVKAMKILKEKMPIAKFVIVGAGKSVPDLKELANSEGVSNMIDFIGWQPHSELSKYLDLADVCIIPQPNNAFINTTIPHKLFEYMSQKKAVIVSDAKPLKRIITETGAGVVFESHDPESFANKILALNSNKSEYYGSKGRKAVEQKYNWKVDSEELLKVYKDLSI